MPCRANQWWARRRTGRRSGPARRPGPPHRPGGSGRRPRHAGRHSRHLIGRREGCASQQPGHSGGGHHRRGCGPASWCPDGPGHRDGGARSGGSAGRWPIQAGEPVHLVADQHPMHGGGRELHAGGDRGRAEPLASAQPQDAPLEPSRGPPGVVGGDAGPVDQASLAELLVASPPAVGGGPGDAISWAM
jgi:hypothetical protein